MRVPGDARQLGSGDRFAILTQRGSGPFRAAICRPDPDKPDLCITLEKLNTNLLRYEILCELDPGEWSHVADAMAKLKDAIPEAAKALDIECQFLRKAG